MKKIILEVVIVLLVIVVAAGATIGILQCNSAGSDDNNSNHVHTYSEAWTYDDTSHWHAATCKHDVALDKAYHNFEDDVCTVCGAKNVISPHVHTYAEEWTHNETAHWHAATCGHSYITGYGEHNWLEDEEGIRCSVCRLSTHTHTYDRLRWQSNSEGHWHPIMCIHNYKLEFAGHVYDENGVCTICNYIAEGSTHVHTVDKTVWVYDEAYSEDVHYHPYSCGCEGGTDIEEHDYEHISRFEHKCKLCSYIYYGLIESV